MCPIFRSWCRLESSETRCRFWLVSWQVALALFPKIILNLILSGLVTLNTFIE